MNLSLLDLYLTGIRVYYVDTTSFPQQRSYEYMMTLILNNGTETDSSASHKTIHLTINEGPTGWELIWNPYEGFSFDTYYIYRGTSPDTLTILDSISSSFTTFTDFDPPWGPLYYAIEILKEEGCFPARDNDYNRSRSNVQFNGVTGISDIRDDGVRIFPNPAREILNFKFSVLNSGIDYELMIYDLQGKPIISTLLNSSKTSINIKDIKPGIYFVRIRCRDSVLIQKLMKF